MFTKAGKFKHILPVKGCQQIVPRAQLETPRSVTTGTPSSSQSEVGEVGSNGEEEAGKEQRRGREAVSCWVRM